MSMRLVGVLIATAWLGLLAQPVSAQSINQKVVRFCKKKLNEKVGSGECSALAYHALRAAHAKELNDFNDHPGAGDYVWGKLVVTVIGRQNGGAAEMANGRTVKPGDIVQYRNAQFAGKGRDGDTYSYHYGHHTAVVVKCNPATGRMTVLEQNVNGKRFVQKTALNWNDLRAGWLRIYRPMAR